VAETGQNTRLGQRRDVDREALELLLTDMLEERDAQARVTKNDLERLLRLGRWIYVLERLVAQ